MNAEKQIANKLAENIDIVPYKSKGGSPLFFDQYAIAIKYANLFGITVLPDLNQFKEAFLIATEGQGGEIHKINSITSSALLPLLVLFRLFGGTNKKYSLKLQLEGYGDVDFDKCFFEVRNKVIRLPSCVDIALYSSSQNVILFLESKFTEFFSVIVHTLYICAFYNFPREL